ncbi:EsaB/YukD family protein [Oceanobacillus manasiensis]|uniref:EsaB/YukD family protein n=1 Tax=Oceanobacillus manasiensis TaxID=586413 RepID=UPI0005A65315|nr:EsaB/YukD family protein [Oceanobacillus manasiensis]
MDNSHIDVTIDFSECGIGSSYDLRIPVQITVKQLLWDLMQTLKMGQLGISKSALKVKTKELLLADDDMLIDYPVTSGDIITVLCDDATRSKKEQEK